MLFGPKQRVVHSDKIPDHCDWPKIKESYVHSVSIALLLRKVAVGTLPTKHCPQNEVETVALPNLLPNVWP
jgi:hypothetical protein